MFFRKANKSEPKNRQLARSITPRDRQAVFAYRAARQQREDSTDRQPSALQERDYALRSTARTRAKAVGFLIVLIVLFGYITWLNTSPRLVVLGSAAQQQLLQNPSVYQQAAAKLLTASPANHNKLTLDASGIAAKLEQAYPELGSVSVQAPLLGHDPQVVLQPAQPALRLSTTSGSTFVVAASGKALALASQPADANVPLVADQSGLPVHLGTAALPTTDVAFIQTVTQQLQVRHLTPSNLVLPQGTSELDVHLSGKPYFIKFNLEADVKQQVGSFLAVNQYLTAHQVTPSQYIDVRVLGRAYYK